MIRLCHLGELFKGGSDISLEASIVIDARDQVWTCPALVERHLLSVPRFVRIARG